MRLSGEPCEQALRSREIALVRSTVVRTKHLREGWVALREVGELVLEPLFRRVSEAGVVFTNTAQPRDLVADLIEPALDDRLERVRPIGRGLEPLDKAPVYGLQVMKRGVVD